MNERIKQLMSSIKTFKEKFRWKYLVHAYIAYNVLQLSILFYFYSPSELLDMYLTLINVKV